LQKKLHPYSALLHNKMTALGAVSSSPRRYCITARSVPLLLLLLAAAQSSPNAIKLDIHVDPTQIVANTSNRFVSFTFDFHLCEVEQPDKPGATCNWNNASALSIDLPRLLPLATALSPYRTALLRIGGGPADSIVYDIGKMPRPVLKRHFVGPLTKEGIGNFSVSCPNGPYCLTMARWDELNGWAIQAGVKIVLGLNALSANMTLGFGSKKAVIAGIPWDDSNVRALLQYTKQRGWFEKGSLYGFELGNEIQGPVQDGPDGTVHKGLSATFHAQQFIALSKMVREIWSSEEVSKRPKLIGPDQNAKAACEYCNWTKAFLQTLRAGNMTLDAFTYHSYDGGGRNDHTPGVLAKALPTPEFLSKHVVNGARFKAEVDAGAAGTELWLGEFADCAGSGVPGVSDAFEGTIDYVDQVDGLLIESIDSLD
jgi:hypothetical protein